MFLAIGESGHTLLYPALTRLMTVQGYCVIHLVLGLLILFITFPTVANGLKNLLHREGRQRQCCGFAVDSLSADGDFCYFRAGTNGTQSGTYLFAGFQFDFIGQFYQQAVYYPAVPPVIFRF